MINVEIQASLKVKLQITIRHEKYSFCVCPKCIDNNNNNNYIATVIIIIIATTSTTTIKPQAMMLLTKMMIAITGIQQ